MLIQTLIFQIALRMVSEDSHHQPVEAARTFNIDRTANDRGCHPEGRTNGEGREDQIRVSLGRGINYFKLFNNCCYLVLLHIFLCLSLQLTPTHGNLIVKFSLKPT